MTRRFFVFLLCMVPFVATAQAPRLAPRGAPGVATAINLNGGPVRLALQAETGFVNIFLHTISIGSASDDPPNTTFDYVNEGGQEILFPFSRLTAELSGGRHHVVFLYQPLEITRSVRFEEQRVIDDIVFPSDENVDVTYSFPFYRGSYLYDFAPASNLELSAGLSLQLRNATLLFASRDGELLTVSQDLGPVPIVKIRSMWRPAKSRVPGLFFGLEADGFYASSAFFNGADFEFTGSIFDASVRAGYSPMPGVDVFANVRALGGGASGTRPASDREFWTQSRDGATDNFLVTGAITLGVRLY